MDSGLHRKTQGVFSHNSGLTTTWNSTAMYTKSAHLQKPAIIYRNGVGIYANGRVQDDRISQQDKQQTLHLAKYFCRLHTKVKFYVVQEGIQ